MWETYPRPKQNETMTEVPHQIPEATPNPMLCMATKVAAVENTKRAPLSRPHTCEGEQRLLSQTIQPRARTARYYTYIFLYTN